MTTDTVGRRFGALELPVQPGAVENSHLFSVFDPAIDRLIAFCQAVIVAELGDAFDAVKALCTNTKIRTASVVQDVLWSEPRASVLRESNYEFPLLAVYRVDEKHDLINLRERRARVRINVDYILPPLVAEDERRVSAVLNAVVRVLASAFEDAGHPSYMSGQAQFFHDDDDDCPAIFASLGLAEVRYGRAEFGEDGSGAEFPIAQMELEAIEYDGQVTPGDVGYGAGATFDAVGLSEHVGGTEGNIPNLVVAEL